jgi:SAM-dependent methyltransferase
MPAPSKLRTRPRHLAASRRPAETAIDYAAHLSAEKETYRGCLDVHDLPAIFHYWSNRYVRPKLEAFGFSTPDEMFLKYVGQQFQNGRGPRRIASIGAGNCHLEVRLASHLLAAGHTDFAIDCLDLNSDMLERGRDAAAKAGAAACMRFLQVDLNAWSAPDEYDGVIANQALHHVLNLENLFAEIKRSLKPGGRFLASDVIGRNGHRRWPEALDLVREFWRKLPPSYRFNQSLLRYEETYQNWDCSGESFEGIRSQDILPLLTGHFHFELFIAFANIVDPFVDRAFGSNFDASAPWDRSFIDQVHARDEKEIASGHIQPTHMLAVMGTDPSVPTLFHEPLAPRRCLRDPARARAGIQVVPAGKGSPYEWGAWPHNDRREIEIACRRLKDAQDRTNEQTILAAERTRWAQRLDREIALATHKIEDLHQELDRRTQWARQLDGQMGERTAWAQRLDGEIEVAARKIKELQQELSRRAAWAHRLDRELRERTLAHRADLDRLAWATALDRRFHAPLDYAFRLLRRWGML